MQASALLKTYLQDHHAGATGGLELARRAAGSNDGSEYGPELTRVAEEIAEDREALEEVMAEVGISPHKLKDAGGWLAEKAGRLKLNGRLTGYSPLSRVLEIEGLVIGVTGKQALWEALQAALGDAIDGIDFSELSRRAGDQRERLEQLRRRAAAEAFESD